MRFNGRFKDGTLYPRYKGAVVKKMKTVIIHGQNHKGSTYNIARILAEKIGGDITEFFSPERFRGILRRMFNLFFKGRKEMSALRKA